MERGVNEVIMEKAMKLQRKSNVKIEELTKGVKPFGAEPVSDEELSGLVSGLSIQDMQTLVAEYGEEQVNILLWKAMTYRMKSQTKHMGVSSGKGAY